MINYQKYVDEIINLVLENSYDNNNRIKEICIEVKRVNGLYILYEMLSNQIGNDFLGCLYEIECNYINFPITKT